LRRMSRLISLLGEFLSDFNENAVISRVVDLRCSFAGVRGKSKFAKALGISPSTYSYYEDGRLPPMPVLLKICELTDTDLYWLLTGRPRDEKVSLLEPVLTKKIAELLEQKPESKAAITAFVELLCEKNNIEKSLTFESAEQSSSKPGWIPILGRTAAGIVHFWHQTELPGSNDAVVKLENLVEKHIGKPILASTNVHIALDLQIGPLLKELKTNKASLVQVNEPCCDADDNQITQFVDCREIHNIFPDAFALQIDGDSMSPRINDSDIIILSPSVPAAQGQIAVACLDEQIGVTCKLIRTSEDMVHLIPINEKYEIKTAPADKLVWALAVLCHIRI